MDLSSPSLADLADVAQPLKILDPLTLRPNGLVLEIVGRESARVRHHDRQVEAELFQRAAAAFKEGRENLPLTDAEKDDLEARRAAAVVVGFSGLTDNGQPVAYSPEVVLQLMRRHAWIQRQVQRAHLDDESFFGSKPGDSSTGRGTTSDSTAPAPTA
ncbi:hypothetical protein VL04_17640 [Chromobacterium violaceum]|uniref:hypothetical protein n=1 Tax=Chromobacterium violaceum TaxID=536 RepID=UPI00065467B2|nr:hypothetical protein [Chromobacterium violaceum]KMN48783.1 hypothetical protein VK93_14905 [Chromobacterium violaceum]KMN87878.1 hypothetical protein VL02_00900 [Chromobacterium violaceum]KMN89107.1 hypothetical protein VL04_17640 [Chromobacterium violaceum]KMO05481.1 hypothetical protein VL16_02885 [Chromobacterium violaceum]